MINLRTFAKELRLVSCIRLFFLWALVILLSFNTPVQGQPYWRQKYLSHKQPATTKICKVCVGRGYISSRYAHYAFDISLPQGGGRVRAKGVVIQGAIDYCNTCTVVGWNPNTVYVWGGPGTKGWPTSTQYKSTSIESTMKKRVQAMGKQYGCRSCGRSYQKCKEQGALTPNGLFIYDHLPPVSVYENYPLALGANRTYTSKYVRTTATYLIEPHCTSCSRAQSTNCRQAKGQKKADMQSWETVANRFMSGNSLTVRNPTYDNVPYARHQKEFADSFKAMDGKKQIEAIQVVADDSSIQILPVPVIYIDQNRKK